jgi:hypothetical protein
MIKTTFYKEKTMNINDLTLGQLKEISDLVQFGNPSPNTITHPLLGRRCIVRTYSAGVHIGDVAWINPNNAMECKLENALRFWRWDKGGLSLSAIANNGVVDARINKTGEVLLTNAIEYIPTTKDAEDSYARFIEDDKD